MKWTITTPPSGRVVDWTLAKAHLRIDADTEQTLVEGMIDAAQDFAQESMACSLLTQTITLTVYPEDVGLTPPALRYGPSQGNVAITSTGQLPAIRLPRGPVQSVTSVLDANGNAITYTLERNGHQDRLKLSGAVVCPIVVVYVAGYGAASAVPALIRQGILVHAGTLYERRESVISGTTIAEVPHSLTDFYRLRSRKASVA